jgi:lysophospholipase L1-like esterase
MLRYSLSGAALSLLVLAAACGGGAASPTGGSALPGDAASDAPSGDAAVADGTTSDAAVDVVDASPSDAQVALALIHYTGRFDTSDPAGPRFAWPGSSIAASFTGTGLDVTLHDAGTNYFAVVIDGGSPTVVGTSKTKSTYTLASNLTGAGPHTVTFTKKTESFDGVVQFVGFAPHAGALVPSPEPFSRAIEYVGDSITCGYGDLGVGPGCSETPAVEDETVSYAYLAAEQLNAAPTVIAYSGLGMYRDYTGSTADQMPTRFGRILADDPTSVWTFPKPSPDAVVINLGTNDFYSGDGGSGDPGPAFSTTYTSFVNQLRVHYPSAAIVCTLSPMLADPGRSIARSYIEGVVSQENAAGDSHVSFLEFAQQQASDGYGCDGHPSKKTHQIMASALVPAVRAATGW